MSAIGRIFVVLNLILSAVFLGWASNAAGKEGDYMQRYNDEAKAHAASVTEKEGEISDLNIQLSTLRDDQRRFIGERDGLKSERDSLQSQLDEARRATGKMQGELATIASTLGDYNDTIAQLSQEKDAAVSRAHEAENERDDATQAAQESELARRDAEEAQGSMETRLADLEGESASLRNELATRDATIAQIVVKYNISPDDMGVVPEIDAAVVEFREDLEPGLVMLNVGKSDGVKRGYRFHIWNGGEYKGQVRVEGVEDSYSSAIVIGTLSGRTISQGDRASTIL